MEKVINIRILSAAICAITLFLASTIVYVTIGDSDSDFWWSFDKINDRLIVINLLLITSFTFRFFCFRMFGVISAFFIFMYGAYEVAWINGFDISPVDFTHLAIVFWILVSIAFFVLQNDKR